MSDTILISACLLGEPCRYDGQGRKNVDLMDRLRGKTLIPVCPEVAGGLPTPRPAAEIRAEGVFRSNGEDVTEAFITGAAACTTLAIQEGVQQAILKSRSPACGCGQIYDGSFSETLIAGDGIFTRHLKQASIACQSDEDFLEQPE